MLLSKFKSTSFPTTADQVGYGWWFSRLRLVISENSLGTVLSEFLIKESKHPKREFSTIGNIPIVGKNIRVFNTCNLREGAKIRKLLHTNNIFLEKCRLRATFYLKRIADGY